MPPRKKSSTKKSNQSVQHTQPAKFGIQQLFERHTQHQASQNPKPQSDPEPVSNSVTVSNVDQDPSMVSPEPSKSNPRKRFKFSPALAIKQSQDDGGDEISWKISPVNERLKALTSKQKPRLIASSLRPCSGNQISSCSVGKVEKWLSSPTTIAAEKSVALPKSVYAPDAELYNIRKSNERSKSLSMDDYKGAFQTPPSHHYGSNQLTSTLAASDVHHRKQLLELLDQVEDAITDDSEPTSNILRESKTTANVKISAQDGTNNLIYSANNVTLDMKNETFLVLEVSEKHKDAESETNPSPIKVLRLLNERNGQEYVLHLCDEWFYSLIGPGDTINVIGEFDDQAKCVINHDNNLLIIHPDILVSGTRVASSFMCPRRAVLDERLKGNNEQSAAALVGTLLHQIFQAGLVNDLPTKQFLEEYAGVVLQKNMENLYASGVNENDIYKTLTEAIPKMMNWIQYFKTPKEPKGVSVEFGQYEGQKSVYVSEVIDIEEVAWAPRYGLKGIIDASVRVMMTSNSGASCEKIMPLEFKTGKGTSGQSAMEHCAQVILYTLLMSDRYLQKDINSGLLYYLHTDQTQGIMVQRSDVVGLVMRRNELATDILKASCTQNLPSMIQTPNICKGCRHLNVCTVYHKAHGGNKEGSGLGDLFENYVHNLTATHYRFLRHWDRLIDLEARVSQVSRQELFHPQKIQGENNANNLGPMVLDVSNEYLLNECKKDGRYIYQFLHQKLLGNDNESHKKDNLDTSGISGCTLRNGDHVILSTKSGRIAVANGIICDVNDLGVSISFSRRLRLPGSDASSEKHNLINEVWRVDKNEFASSFATMRFNLMQLFVQSFESSHLRKMIVDLESPRFDSGGIFSQDPALSYIRSENTLNDDQRRAIHKILTSKDYTLILGMPGTGKTSTMVHAVKALLIRGSSVLLTSYMNSAVDNLLVKLKAQGIDFVRIGRREVVHHDIQEHCMSGMEVVSVNDIKQRMKHVRVVGVTCLGINHPLLANKKFDVCIMDEAGQITLPVSLGPLMLASRFVLVGDHYQLPPLVQSVEARENGMSVSLFCRLSEAHPQAISALQCQYRMCSAIMELSNALIYGNRLRCGSAEIANAKLKLSSTRAFSLWLKEVLNPNKPVIFIDTDQLPAREVRENKTVYNPQEAYIISQIAKELVRRDVPADEIGIITPYNSQANHIRQQLDASMEIHTIDKYQGRDKDCILLSFVRSAENSRACTSSLLGDWHRINVALTRAKKKLIMVGSRSTLSKVPLLNLLADKVEEQGGILCILEKDLNLNEFKKCSNV